MQNKDSRRVQNIEQISFKEDEKFPVPTADLRVLNIDKNI